VTDAILDVDLLAFEQGNQDQRRAVTDGVLRSLATGFVYTSHDIPVDVLDAAYELLTKFFSLPAHIKARYVAPGTHGQTGYTGLGVETAAISDTPDWKEMLNWGRPVPPGHPIRRAYPHQYADQIFPEADVPGITEVLMALHDRLIDLQRRFLRVIAVALGCDELFFDDLLIDGATLDRAIHYPPVSDQARVWAAEHGDINLITALPRATTPGLQVKTGDGWVDAVAPAGHVVINTGLMLERLSNGVLPAGIHRVVAPEGSAASSAGLASAGLASAGLASADRYPADRYSVVQFCHPSPWMILSPLPSCLTPSRPSRYGAIRAGDLLERVLWEINLIEDGRRV
jgi:isopenicillin N synthase-like dioxygenase